jgi:hypothetical protein
VDEAIEDGPVPFFRGDLAYDEGGFSSVTVLDDYEEVTALLFGKRRDSPIVQDEEIEACESVESLAYRPSPRPTPSASSSRGRRTYLAKYFSRQALCPHPRTAVLPLIEDGFHDLCGVGADRLSPVDQPGGRPVEVLPVGRGRCSFSVVYLPLRASLPPPLHHPLSSWPEFQRKLRKKGVTLMLLWEEYREQHSEGYPYSRFCELYRPWLSRRDLVLRQEYKAGQKMFVDSVGKTVPVVDPVTGEVREAQIFDAGRNSLSESQVSSTSSGNG